MSAFVSRPPIADAAPPAAPDPELITGDGWWPDVDLAKLREIVRIDTTVTPIRLREAAADAIIELGAELAEWRAPLEAAGHANLHAVPAPQIDGQSQKVTLYTRAIYSSVAADLAERLKDVSATAAGMERADELACPADEFRRNVRWAIARLTGKNHVVVELI